MPNRTTTKLFTWTLLGLLVFSGCSAEDPGSAPAPESSNAPKPVGTIDKTNLLLITIDTLRADRLGSYGYADAATPNLDRLAEQGTRMGHALTHVPMTLPAHASLMTGRLPIHTGTRNNGTYVVPESELTLAERLKTEGYSTAAALGSFVLLKKFGLDQGFDSYDDALAETEILRAFNTEIPADRVLKKWRSWLRIHQDDERGFFYWAHFYDPHLPYAPPEPFRSRFMDRPYDGEVAFVDQQIGEMLADLDSLGLLDSTLVVVTSDHGEAFGEHGELGHGLTAYRPALHVPLILRGPGIPEANVVDNRVGLTDLFPSILELLGLEPSSDADAPALDGKSFVNLIRGEEEPEPREVYFESMLGKEDRNWAPLTGLYSGDRKLISLPKPELYDTILDSDEAKNLLSEERRTYRALDEKLQALLLGSTESDRRELSDEDRQKLESLGYVSGGSRAQAMLDPKDGLKLDAELRKIEALLNSENLDQAGRALEDVRRQFPNQALPSLYLIEHRIAVQQGRVDAAVAALERGSEALPDIYPLRYELAKYLIDQQDTNKAQEVSRALVEKQPELSQGWILLGRSLESSDPDQAGQAYEKARALDPGNTALIERMAELQLHVGDLNGAVGLFDELIRIGFYDDRPEGLFKTAMLHMRLGSIQESERLFGMGLSLDPQPFFYMSYAMVLDRNGKRQDAIAALQQALASDELPADQKQLARSTLDRWLSAP